MHAVASANSLYTMSPGLNIAPSFGADTFQKVLDFAFSVHRTHKQSVYVWKKGEEDCFRITYVLDGQYSVERIPVMYDGDEFYAGLVL